MYPIMRILHIIASFNPVTGGPAEAIRNIILEYNKLDIKAEVVCLDKPESLSLGPLPYDVHALGHTNSVWFYSPNLTTWVKANIDRFDAVIIHGLWLYPSYAVSNVLQSLRTESVDGQGLRKVPPMFVFPHGMLDPYFQRSVQRRLKAARNWLYWKLIERRVINSADALLFTCETELLLARQTFRPYKPKKEINVGYGIVEPPAFDTAMADAFATACPAVAGRPYLLFLSRINYKKGVDLLINAYAEIAAAKSTLDDTFPQLVIAGPGMDSAYGETIRQLVGKFPILDGLIHFPGMLTGDAKWGSIYGCEAFALPSHQENFGIAVAEALACGKPVLISDQVNIWREIMQGKGGIISDDTLNGTQRMLEQWLCMSPAEQQQMGTNARSVFETYFRMEHVIHRLNTVFESMT